MMMLVPGRILVIDDMPKEVEGIIGSLREKGENVLYTTSIPEEELLQNTRLLIIDLFLIPDDEDASYDMVASIIRKINEKAKFFIVAIWTKHVKNAEEAKDVETKLKDTLGKEELAKLKAIFLEPFGKYLTEAVLAKKLEQIIVTDPLCGVIFEIEREIEMARDNVVSDIMSAGSMPVTLKALKEEVGKETLGRQMIELYLKILCRYSKPTQKMSESISRLVSSGGTIDLKKYGFIYNLRSYYDIAENEQIWTGDVLKKINGNDEYAVIVSPACDFAQKKLGFIKTILASRINHDDFETQQVDEIKKKLGIEKGSMKDCIGLILKAGANLPKKSYILRYLKDKETGTLFHLIVNLQQVSHIPFKELAESLKEEGYIRVCRIDAPQIDDLLQTYSAYSSRIGTQSVPEEIVKEAQKKVTEKQTVTTDGQTQLPPP